MWSNTSSVKIKAILFDWGDTVMRDIPGYSGPMKDWPEVHEVEGIREALTELASEYDCYLATNAQDSTESQIWEALERADLKKFFKRVFCFKNIGYRKNDIKYFETVLSILKLEPGQVVMVGDSFEKDIKSANNSGIFGIWYNTKNSKIEEGTMYKSINSLRELKTIIQKPG